LTEFFQNYFAAKEQNEGEFDMEDLKECEELSLDKMAFKVNLNSIDNHFHIEFASKENTKQAFSALVLLFKSSF